MSDRKSEILSQLEQGKINASEAFEMLNQLSEHTTSSQHDTEYCGNGPAPQAQDAPPPHTHPGWVEGLVGDISGAVQDAIEGIKDMNIGVSISEFMDGTYGHHKNTMTFTSNPVLQGISKLVIIGKNARVSVNGYDGNVIRVKCAYDARHPNTEVLFHEENGIYQVMYDESRIRTMEIACEVPHAMINSAHIASKNGAIHVQDIRAVDVALYTKNAKILANNINCAKFVAQSRNDAIKVRTLASSNVHLETTNAKIHTEDMRADNAQLKTSNSGIKIEKIDVANLKLHTTNTGLKLDKLNVGSWHGVRTLEAYTTNGGISLSTLSDIGVRVYACAAGGKLIWKKDDIYFSESSKYQAQGESSNYAICEGKLNVRLSTTNASIKIK